MLAHMWGAKAGQLINFDAAVEQKWVEFGWDHARATVDRDAALLCPLIRLDRLMLRAQAQTRATRGQDDPSGAAMEVHYRNAEARTAALDRLQFDAVEVPIVTGYGSLAARLN